MKNEDRVEIERDEVDEAMFEAARGDIPPMSSDMTSRIMGEINKPSHRKPFAAIALGIAATAAFLVIQFFPALTMKGDSGVVSTDSGTSQTGLVPHVDLNLPTPKITLGMVLPETDKALTRNRESLISYAKAVQSSTLIFSGGVFEEEENNNNHGL
ncbi:MAG: hypothetical protein JJU11_02405 [Candidatus Sumerlaeia bacterium]|nr:hypothetical protein [Candidatus Sumerlaeia bacterium]